MRKKENTKEEQDGNKKEPKLSGDWKKTQDEEQQNKIIYTPQQARRLRVMQEKRKKVKTRGKESGAVMEEKEKKGAN